MKCEATGKPKDQCTCIECTIELIARRVVTPEYIRGKQEIQARIEEEYRERDSD